MISSGDLQIQFLWALENLDGRRGRNIFKNLNLLHVKPGLMAHHTVDIISPAGQLAVAQQGGATLTD